MKTYDEYENLIVDRLKSNADTDVSPLPLIESLNDPRSVIRPRIYVIYTGSTFEDTQNLGDFAQYETLTFEVYFQARTRQGDSGIFSVAEEAIQLLMKWKLPDAKENITISNFGYVTGIQNYWQYQLKFSFPRVRVIREETVDGQLIKKITHIYNVAE